MKAACRLGAFLVTALLLTLIPARAADKPKPEKVPEQYNTKSTLTKDITAENASQLDFPLVTK